MKYGNEYRLKHILCKIFDITKSFTTLNGSIEGVLLIIPICYRSVRDHVALSYKIHYKNLRLFLDILYTSVSMVIEN